MAAIGCGCYGASSIGLRASPLPFIPMDVQANSCSEKGMKICLDNN